MPFNSKTGAEAGKKSKKVNTKEINATREQLLSVANGIITDFNNENLSKTDKFKLLELCLAYSVPKQRIQEVTTNDISNNNRTPIEITLEEAKTIRKALEDKY